MSAQMESEITTDADHSGAGSRRIGQALTHGETSTSIPALLGDGGPAGLTPPESADGRPSPERGDERRRLVGQTRMDLEAMLMRWGEPAYRGRQIARWIYSRGARDVSEMTDLPAALRSRLASETDLSPLTVLRRQLARDGTEKFLFGLPDGEAIESVVLPFEDRVSLCVSSQVGCPIRCAFCATGRSGYARNLTAGEIADQVLAAGKLSGRAISHIVFMGMGEPLMNTGNVLKAARLMHDEMGVSMRHITISTVGLAPEMRALANAREQFTLALSLHAPNDALRETLIPVARRYPLRELMDACRYYRERTGRRVTYEYVLLRGVNDQPEHARQLAALLASHRGHVNLIPYNPGAADEYHAPRTDVVARFRRILDDAGIPVTQRVEKGQEIMAACGQLRKHVLGGARAERLISPETLITTPGE